MLVKIDEAWINSDHVTYVSISDEMQTRIDLSDGEFVLCNLPPDEVAAILNGEADDAAE